MVLIQTGRKTTLLQSYIELPRHLKKTSHNRKTFNFNKKSSAYLLTNIGTLPYDDPTKTI